MTESTWSWLSSTRAVLSACGRREWPGRPIPDLPALTQIMVGNDARHHGLADRHGADAEARIMPARGYDFALPAIAVDGAAGGQNRRGGLHDETRNDRLSGGNAAQDAAGVVGKEARPAVVPHADFVGVLLAAVCRDRKAVADLDALDRVDAHQPGGEIGVELAIDRCAQACRHGVRYDLDHGGGSVERR